MHMPKKLTNLMYKDTFTIQTCGENGIGQAIVGGAVRLYRQT